MASGLPVVAAGAGGVPDLVRSGEDGLLLPPDDSARWVDEVGGLIEDRARRIGLGDPARRASGRGLNKGGRLPARGGFGRVFGAASRQTARWGPVGRRGGADLED